MTSMTLKIIKIYFVMTLVVHLVKMDFKKIIILLDVHSPEPGNSGVTKSLLPDFHLWERKIKILCELKY